jgi:hypothetical protein
VLYTHLADENLGLNCVRRVETIALFLSKEYLNKYKTCFMALHTQCTPDFLAKNCTVHHGDFPKSACLMCKDVASVLEHLCGNYRLVMLPTLYYLCKDFASLTQYTVLYSINRQKNYSVQKAFVFFKAVACSVVYF